MRRIAFLLCLVASAIAFACGETRGPIGEDCLRGEDCLSGVCSAGKCVAAPALVSGGEPAPDETPRIPSGDSGARDAPAEGG